MNASYFIKNTCIVGSVGIISTSSIIFTSLKVHSDVTSKYAISALITSIATIIFYHHFIRVPFLLYKAKHDEKNHEAKALNNLKNINQQTIDYNEFILSKDELINYDHSLNKMTTHSPNNAPPNSPNTPYKINRNILFEGYKHDSKDPVDLSNFDSQFKDPLNLDKKKRQMDRMAKKIETLEETIEFLKKAVEELQAKENTHVLQNNVQACKV